MDEKNKSFSFIERQIKISGKPNTCIKVKSYIVNLKISKISNLSILIYLTKGQIKIVLNKNKTPVTTLECTTGKISSNIL